MITLSNKFRSADSTLPRVTGVSVVGAYASVQCQEEIKPPHSQHFKLTLHPIHAASFPPRPTIVGGTFFKVKRSSETALQPQKAKRLQLVVSLPQTGSKKRGGSLPLHQLEQSSQVPPPCQHHDNWKLSMWPHSSAPLAASRHFSIKQQPRKAGWMHGYSLTDPFLRLSLN